MDYPIGFVHPKLIMNRLIAKYSCLSCCLFSTKKNATLEPAKPLNNAQIGGSFFYYTHMKTSFTKPYSSPEQIVQILKSRGMLMDDERKVENYLLNIGYHRLSAYIYSFYKSPKSDLMLKEGTTFEQVLSRYYPTIWIAT